LFKLLKYNLIFNSSLYNNNNDYNCVRCKWVWKVRFIMFLIIHLYNDIEIKGLINKGVALVLIWQIN
jgi:hypothetical protein